MLTKTVSMYSKTKCNDCSYSCMHNVYKDSDFSLLNINKSEVDHKRGTTIISQGTFISQVLYLKKGLVKVVVQNQDNSNAIIKIVTEGNYLALHALGNNSYYDYSVIALSDIEICYIKKESLHEIMTKNIKAFNYLLEWYTQEYGFLCNKLGQYNSLNNIGRFTHVLNYLSTGELSKYGVLGYVSRKDLSELASISLESVNKIITQLKNEGIIELINRKITILKPNDIKRLSDLG